MSDDPGSEPDDADEFSRVVFDEAFIRGGVRESSLRRLNVPVPRAAPGGPRDWTAGTKSGGQRPRTRWKVMLTAAALSAAAVLIVANHHGGGSKAGILPFPGPSGDPISASGLQSSPSPDSTEPEVNGLTPATRTGTCFDTHSVSSTQLQVTILSCSTKHTYELVAIERASGDDSQYPDGSYWNGPVAQRCDDDLTRYVGRPAAQWPAGLDSSEFVPVTRGWASGDRTIYCLAYSTPGATRSARNAPPAHTSPVPAPPTAAAA